MKRRPPTHCKKGHEYTPENTAHRPDTGYRICRTCRTERDKARDRRSDADVQAARLAGLAKARAANKAAAEIRRAALIENIEFLLEHHEHPHRIAARVGYKPDSLPRTLYKIGRPDLARAVEIHTKEHAA